MVKYVLEEEIDLWDISKIKNKLSKLLINKGIYIQVMLVS